MSRLETWFLIAACVVCGGALLAWAHHLMLERIFEHCVCH